MQALFCPVTQRQTGNSVPAFHTQLNLQWPGLKSLRVRESMSKLEEKIETG